MKKAVVLLSGGIDSTTCLALAQSEGYTCYALSFDYQQRHAAELAAAQRIATHYGVSHKVITISMGEIGGSALTDMTIAVPDYVGDDAIPNTYVPARNTIFLSFALAYAETLGAQHIFVGCSAVDYSGYPDCRPVYFEAFQQLATLATQSGIAGDPFSIHTPLLHLSKADTVKLGEQLGVDYQLTVSCYRADAQGRACQTCDSCVLRKKGFLEANLLDPTRYYTTDMLSKS